MALKELSKNLSSSEGSVMENYPVSKHMKNLILSAQAHMLFCFMYMHQCKVKKGWVKVNTNQQVW